MKVVLSILCGIGCLIFLIVHKAVYNASTYMDDSFRWGGRDG